MTSQLRLKIVDGNYAPSLKFSELTAFLYLTSSNRREIELLAESQGFYLGYFSTGRAARIMLLDPRGRQTMTITVSYPHCAHPVVNTTVPSRRYPDRRGWHKPDCRS
jgi:hypothetical protein